MLNTKNSQTTATLAKKTMDGDYCFLKFSLSDPEKVLGHRIGQSVQIAKDGDQPIWRHYIPLSRLDEQGSADFLVKLIDKNTEITEKGLFSHVIRDATVGDKFIIKGPFHNWLYDGFGRILLAPNHPHNSNKPQPADKPEDNPEGVFKGHFENIVMVAHDNAVTAFFTLIDTLSMFPKDKTSLTLVYFVDKIVNYVQS